MATKTFKELPKTTTPMSMEDLQKQLATAQAALAAAGHPPAVGVAAPAATQAPETKPEDVPVVVSTGAGAPIDLGAVKPVPPSPAAPAPGNVAPAPAMPAMPQNAALSSPTDFMALMTGGNAPADSMNALMAAAETDSSGGKMLFPMLTQQAGTTGGAFQRVNTKNAEFASLDLPEGRRPFTGIFIGYRYLGTCWPKGYDANNVSTKPAAPLWNVAVPNANGPAAAQLMLAGKAFQFSKDRKSFDVDAGGPGIIRPALEFLLFDADIGLFVFRTAGHYNAAKDARDQLIACAVTQADGSQRLLPFMGEFHPETHKQTRQSGGQPIVHHYPRIVKIAENDARVANAAVAYKAFLAAATPEIRDKTTEWFNGSDAPITNVAMQAINDAASRN